MANTLAYYDTAIITAIKSFIVQAPGVTHDDPNIFIGWATGVMYFKVRTIDTLIKNRLLKFSCVPATSATFLAFFAVATNSTNETNKAGSTCH